MRKRQRRDIETGSLSFLDVICCGFGAVILLLVITKIFEPIRLEESHIQLENLIVRYQQELEEILGETNVVVRERLATIDRVDSDETLIARLQRELTRIRAEFLATQDDAEIANELEGELALAKQRLTEEMQRLLANYKPDPDEYKIGGIPVDSEYIIFIIDTSGFFQRYACSRVQDLFLFLL